MDNYLDVWLKTFSEPFITEEETSSETEPGQRIGFPDSARKRHAIVFGGTGTGKTRFIQGLAMSDVVRRVKGFSQRGWAIIDTQGDLFNEMKQRLAILNLKLQELGQPGLENWVYLIDPVNEEWGVQYNPLSLRIGEYPERKADRLANTVIELFSDDSNITVRLYQLLFRSFWTLSLAGKSLTDMPRLLRDEEWRKQVLLKLNNEELSAYWTLDFPDRARDVREETASTRRRIDRMVNDPGMKHMLGGDSSIDIREIIDGGRFLLVNAPQSDLGEGTANILSAFIISEIFHAAMQRKDQPLLAKRRPFTLFADEFQNYLRITLERIVRESRKLGLELVLATQDVRGSVGDEDLMRIVRTIIQNKFVFRQSRDGAELLHKEVFNPKLYQAKAVTERYQRAPSIFGEYLESFDQVAYKNLEEIYEEAVRALTELPDRHFWKKQEKHEPVMAKTIQVPDLDQLADETYRKRALSLFNKLAFNNGGRLKLKALPAPSEVDLHTEDERDADESIWGE